MFMPVQVNSYIVHNAYVESIKNLHDKPVWQEAEKKYCPEENVKNIYTQPLFYANLFCVFLF